MADLRRRAPRTFTRPKKPALRREVTTLWDYPSQNYEGRQGDTRFKGATPSYVIWNLIDRYTREGDLVVDPCCGSGTTLDVARDTNRRAQGFDLAPTRKDITKADARRLPIDANVAQLVFVDPPYGDHIDYSDDPACIGKLSAYEPAYYTEMSKLLREAHRVLKPGGTIGVYVCDYFEKKRGFAPVGAQLLGYMNDHFEIVDIVCVARHNKTLEMGNFRRAADEGGFFLRGFNYLLIGRKPTKK